MTSKMQLGLCFSSVTFTGPKSKPINYLSNTGLEHSMRSIGHVPPPTSPGVSQQFLPVAVAHAKPCLSSRPSLNPSSCRRLPVTALEPEHLQCVYTGGPLNTEDVLPVLLRCLVCLRLGGLLLVFLCPSSVPMAGDQSAQLAGLSCSKTVFTALAFHDLKRSPSVSGHFICKSVRVGREEWMGKTV